MKKSPLVYIIISFAVLVLVLNGCYYDEVAGFEGLPQNVSFKNDVIPIFNASCNTKGCHDAEGSHSPSLVQANAYNSLTKGNYVNPIEPEKSKLYLEISSGNMPPTSPMNINQQKIILAWITEGAQNN